MNINEVTQLIRSVGGIPLFSMSKIDDWRLFVFTTICCFGRISLIFIILGSLIAQPIKHAISQWKFYTKLYSAPTRFKSSSFIHDHTGNIPETVVWRNGGKLSHWSRYWNQNKQQKLSSLFIFFTYRLNSFILPLIFTSMCLICRVYFKLHNCALLYPYVWCPS